MNSSHLIPIPIPDSRQGVHTRATFQHSAINRHLTIPLILTLVVSMTTAATALPLSGRYITGIVRKMDWQAQEAEISLPETGQSIIFTWNRRTRFLANGEVAGSGILKPETMIQVIYHQPFFGRPFVSRVTALSIPSEILPKGSGSMAKPTCSLFFIMQRPRSPRRFFQSPSNPSISK